MSFPYGEKVLKEVNRLPKKKQLRFFREYNKKGVGIVGAFVKVTGKTPFETT